MAGSPQDSGVSRMAHQQKRAIAIAMMAGNTKLPRQVCAIPKSPARATPAIARNPSEKLPMVWETFHILILKLRSFWLNQCAMIRPQGGQPKPLSQPTTSISTKMMAVLTAVLVPKGITPRPIIVRADRMRPMHRNLRASERSDTLPITNLLNAYAIDTADMARPTFPASRIPSLIISGAASDRFLRTR